MEGAPKGHAFGILCTVWQISKNTSELKVSIYLFIFMLQFGVFATDSNKELVHNMFFKEKNLKAP